MAEGESTQALSFFDANASFGRREVPGLKRIETADELIAEMDFVGIDEALVWHSSQTDFSPVDANRIAIEETKPHARLHPTWAILPHQTGELGTPEEFFAAMRAQRVRALWMRPAIHHWLPTRTGIGATLELAVERRAPVFMARTTTTEAGSGWALAERLLTDFPGIRLVVTGTGSWGEDRYFRPLLERFQGLYLELSRYELAGGLEELVRLYGPDRWLFGSGCPANTMGGPMMCVATAAIDPATRQAVAGGNLRRLLAEANT